MKITKNKKGLIDDFGSLLVAGLIMVALAIGILLYSGLQTQTYKERANPVSNLIDTSYMTRTVLDWELESGIKVHEAITKHYEENNIEQLAQELQKELEKQGLLPTQTWVLVIKKDSATPIVKDTSQENKFLEIEGRRNEIKRNSYLAMKGVKIPHNNEMLEIIIKRITQEDLDYYQNQERIKSIGKSGVLSG